MSALVGFEIADDGFLALALNIKDQEATSRGVQDGVGATGLAATGFPVADPVVIWGQPNVDNDYKFAVNTAIPTEAGEVYGFGTYATRDVDGSFFFRNPTNRSGFFVDGAGNHLFTDTTGEGGCPVAPLPTASFAEASAFVEGAPDNCFSFFSQFPGGFTPRFGGTVEDTAITAGFRGEIDGGLTFDFSACIGSNNMDYFISDTVNASLGPNSPNSFDLGSQTQTEFVANADFSYAKDVGLASDLNIAFGAQFLTEEFEISASESQSFAVGEFIDQGFSAGSNGFQGFNDQVAGSFERENTGVYLDLEADVTDKIILTGPLRYKDFSDFGGTLNAKVAGLYEVNENLNLRGSWSTGFRAPTLGQSNLQRSSTGFSGGQLTEQLTIASTNPIESDYGLTDLTLAYNYNDTDVTDRGATITDARENELERSLPSSRLVATVAHQADKFDALVRFNYYSEVFDSLFQDPGLPITTPGLEIFDPEVGYTFNDTFRIGVGAKNIFDTFPEEYETEGFTGESGEFLRLIFPPNHPVGFNGGSYYLSMSSAF